jgi:hypothetical protein
VTFAVGRNAADCPIDRGVFLERQPHAKHIYAPDGAIADTAGGFSMEQIIASVALPIGEALSIRNNSIASGSGTKRLCIVTGPHVDEP